MRGQETKQFIYPQAEQLLEGMNDAFVSIGYDWHCNYANDIALGLIRKIKDEITAGPVWDIFPDFMGVNLKKQYSRTMKQRVVSCFESHCAQRDIWLSVRAYPAENGISVFFTDITEKKKASDIIADSEKWFRNIADNAPVMIWGAGTNRLRNYFNYMWLEFTGCTFAQEEGNGWIKNVHKDDVQRVLKTYNEAFDKQDGFCQHWRLKRNDGDYRWVSVSGKPMYGPESSFLGYIGFCVDIHEQVTVYQKLENHVKERTIELAFSLEQERKLNTMKSYFVSMASHEFRTPLSTVLSSVNLIEQYVDRGQPEQTKRHTDRVKLSVKHLIQLLDDFLSVDKLEHSDLKSVTELFDLDDFAKEVAGTLDGSLKNGQRIRQTYIGSKKVYSDRNIISHILLNLLSNAVKYSDKDVSLELQVGDEYINIVVADKGIGIPEEEQERLFGKYFRASNTGNVKGTGLGLNIVQRYVELLKGNITFSSKKNIGTKFIVQIPNGQPVE